MSCTRSMSEVSSTPSANENSSSVRVSTASAAASANVAASANPSISRAFAMLRSHLDDDALAQAAAGDLERHAQAVRNHLEDQHAGGQELHALLVELEPLGDL